MERQLGEGSRTIGNKVIQARVAVLLRRFGREPAKDSARLGGRRWVREEGYGEGGTRVREGGRGRDEMIEQPLPRGVFEGGGGRMGRDLVREDARGR